MPQPINQPRSNCCQASMRVSTVDEGTSYYICSKCNNPCDQYVGEQPKLSLRDKIAVKVHERNGKVDEGRTVDELVALFQIHEDVSIREARINEIYMAEEQSLSSDRLWKYLYARLDNLREGKE